MSKKYTSTKISCYVGLVVQAVVNNFLPILFVALQDVYKLSYEQLARLIVFNFVTQMTVDILTPRIIDRIGYRMTAVLCQGTAAAGLALLGILPNIMADKYLAIVIPAVIYALGSGLMEVILSPMVEMLPTNNKAGNMSVLHSFYCWGQAFTVAVTTALVYAFGYGKWTYIPLIWAVLPFLNMLSFFKVPVIEPKPEQKRSSFAELIKQPKFIIYMLMMLCAGACEIAMSQWASLFAQRALGVSKVIGDMAGPFAFAIFMGAGRIFYAAVSSKIQFEKLLVILGSACFGCYMAVALCKIPMVALICCAICGFTVSISWPGTYSAGAREFPKGETTMFSIFAMCGDTGCCVGPWIIGIVADSKGLNIGMSAAAFFPVLIVILALINIKCCKIRQ